MRFARLFFSFILLYAQKIIKQTDKINICAHINGLRSRHGDDITYLQLRRCGTQKIQFVDLYIVPATKVVTIKNNTVKNFFPFYLYLFSFQIFFRLLRTYTYTCTNKNMSNTTYSTFYIWTQTYIYMASVSDFCCIAQLNFHKLYAKTDTHTNNMQDADAEIAQWGIF